MMRFFVVLLLGLSVSMLVSCGGNSAQGTKFIPPEGLGGILCIDQCMKSKNYCQTGCSLGNRQCVGQAQAQAMIDYDAYVRDQVTHHRPTEFRARDFERTKGCDTSSKACTEKCENVYASCYTSCGGTIEQSTSCLFMCF